MQLARWVPNSVPWLGPKVWGSVDAFYRQALAKPFLTAWHGSGQDDDPLVPGA